MVTKPLETENAHAFPFVRQFSVFLANRVGKLREMTERLTAENVGLAALDVVDSNDWAVVRTIFTNPDAGRDMLNRANLPFTECPLLAMELKSPAALTDLSHALLAAELNLLVLYPMLITSNGHPVIAFNVEDRPMAVQILRSRGFTLLDEKDLWPETPDA